MKRQIIICVCLLFLLILIVFAFVKMGTRDELPDNETETEQETTENNRAEVTEITKETGYKYRIVEEEGRLTVYETKYKTVFLETAIKALYLPEEIQEDLIDGIYFETDKDMFDFLESYSS